MDKSEFKNMVEKYKNELIKMAGLEVNAAETVKNNTPNSQENTEQSMGGENPNAENNETSVQNTVPNDAVLNPDSFPEDSENAVDNSEELTYQEFMDQNGQYGYLKVQAFAAEQALPISGVKITVSKNFKDMNKVFFEGVTDESGLIDGIKLPSPSKKISEHPSNTLPYSTYNFSSSYEQNDTESNPKVQIFQGIKTIQPVRIIL